MNFKEYQERCPDTWGGKARKSRALIGISSESGEILEKLKKFLRGDFDSIYFKESLKKELGDVLFYISVTCTEYGFNLEEIAIANIQKLADRKKRGVINGSGDNR